MEMEYEQEETGQKSEERKELRWNIPIPVSVKGVRGDGTEFCEESITADASPMGMCLLLTVELRRGDQVTVIAPEEKFESSATVCFVSNLGPNMNRIRIKFPQGTKFDREAAPKKYIYDYHDADWVGYILEGTYYNTKHEPFGKVENNDILDLDSGAVLFRIRTGRVYDIRSYCIGHII